MRKNSFSLVGPIAEETLRRLNADILFLGVNRFDVQYGLSTPNILEAKVNRVMVEVANERSRYGLQQIWAAQPVSDSSSLGPARAITDRAAPKADLRTLKKAGVKIKNCLNHPPN